MKKQITSIIVLVLLLSVSGNRLYAGTYSGGTGESNNPYKIGTVADWQELMTASGDWDKYFVLTADIDLAGVTVTPIAPDTDVSTWYFEGTAFTGVFDGNNHVIRNTIINQPSSSDNYVGLFGLVSGGQIKNLGVENINITGDSGVGGLVGENRGSVTSCYATGSVRSQSVNVGGLVGVNYGSVTSCYATASVMGGGGLVGFNDVSGVVTSCYATGSVLGAREVGGLVGCNNGTVTNCYATGSVHGFEEVGGLVGANGGNLTSCYATGSVSSRSVHVGGLLGFNGISGVVTSCYATGSVSGWEFGGYIAGLVGYNGGSVASSFWDTETSGQSSSAGGKGLTTTQMKTLAIFHNAGWGSFGWVMADGVDFPRLSWEGTGYPAILPADTTIPLNGSGTQADPYQIWTPADFALLIWYPSTLDKHFLLMSDIDVAGEFLYPIGDSIAPFTGVFDGNDHIILNAVINLPYSDNVGLFGYVGSGGQIKNLGVEDVNITGRSDVSGGLVGRNCGSVTSCYATGAVNGDRDAGGLVGFNNDSGVVTSCYATGSVSGVREVGGLVGDNSGTVTNCYATGSVNGTWYGAGGLVGWNFGSVTSCYATGSVSGGDHVGGLVGWNNSFVTSCYATGSVSGMENVGGLVGYNSGNVTSSFWDVNTSGCSTSSDGTGKTTQEMKTLATFTSAGWDFMGETANGTADTWIMLPDDYPRLSWEDDTPPELNLSVTPALIWPPNHKMVKIAPSWTVKDDYDPSPEVSLVGVTCNDKNAANDDIRIDNDGSIYLRAEKGRIYTITYKACDESGNCTAQSATVTVPHDNRR